MLRIGRTHSTDRQPAARPAVTPYLLDGACEGAGAELDYAPGARVAATALVVSKPIEKRAEKPSLFHGLKEIKV